MTPSACGGKIWGQCCSTPSYLSLAPDFYWLIHPALETSGHRRSPWSSFSKGWFAGGKSWPWSAMFLLRACLNSSVSTITYRRGGVAIYPSEIILSLPPPPPAPNLSSVSWKTLQRYIHESPPSWDALCPWFTEHIYAVVERVWGFGFRPHFKS